jgi:Integrase core domain
MIETWRRHYNEVRPHSSLGNLTPAEFVANVKNQDAAAAQATGQVAAVCGASGPWPVAKPSHKGQSEQQPRVAISS